MDRLKCMSVFVRVVEAGSLAAVAESVGMTAPMVGRHVRALEDDLGAQLRRTTRRQSLTEAGRIYYERSKSILADLEAADESVARMRSVARGTLRVDAPVTFGSPRPAPALPDYLAAHPEVRVELTLNNRVVDLVEEGYDAVIRTGDLPDSGLMARALAPYRLVACASREYLEQRGVPRRPDDLTSHACLGFHPGFAFDTWSFQGGAGQPPVIKVKVNGPLSTNHGHALREAALCGAGVILQSEALVEADLASGRLTRLLEDNPPQPLPMHILYSPTRAVTPKLRSFLDFVTERFGPR